MPAGGRRPGAGAPRNNQNAQKGGAYSRRYLLTLVFMFTTQHRQPVADALHDAGLFKRCTAPDRADWWGFTGDMRTTTRLVADRFIDSPEIGLPDAIKGLPMPQLRALVCRLAEESAARHSEVTRKTSKNNQTIKSGASARR